MKPEGITKDEYDSVREEYEFDERNNPEKKDKNPMSYFKWKQKSTMRKSVKKRDEILIFLLNLKKQIEGPVLVKIYGGNFFVIRNHVYRFNPDRVFTFGKFKAGIAKEFDREMVGIDDYQDVVIKDYVSNNPGRRINTDDPVLIKALIQARLSEKPALGTNMKTIIIILLIVGAAIGLIWYFGGKKSPTPAPVTPTPATP